MKLLKYITATILITFMLYSCYKEDNSSLYSRQYVMHSKLSSINSQINDINAEIANIKELYETMVNNSTIKSIEYLPDKENPTHAKVTFGDGQTLTIPFGSKGEDGIDGIDGKTPVITISEDGYWVIDGEKTTHKVSGNTPIIRAIQDPNNPNDPNFYWTVQYGNEKPKFILVDGEKIQANGEKGDKGNAGPKGDKGDTGPRGPEGTQPIKNITEEDGIVTFETTFGNFTFNMSSLLFTLKPENIPTFNLGKNTISYDNPTQSIQIPFEISNDVASIGATLPSGWTYETDLTNKIITLTAPSHENLSAALYDGTAIFIAFDQKRKSVTQNINVHLSTKIYLDYFYNPLNSVPIFRSSNKAQNQIVLSTEGWQGNTLDNRLYYAIFDASEKKLLENNEIAIDNITNPDLMRSFPNFNIEDKPEYLNKEITIISFISDTESTDYHWPTQNVNEKDKVEKYHFLTKNYIMNPNNTASKLPTVAGKEYKDENGNFLFLDCPGYNSYYAITTLFSEKGSAVVRNRLHRASNFTKIIVKNPKEKFGLPDNFDIKKLNVFQSHTNRAVNAFDAERYSNSNKGRYLCADSRFMIYDKVEDILTITYYYYHTATNHYKIYIYYDGAPLKKIWNSNFRTDIISKELDVCIYIDVPNSYSNTINNSYSYKVIWRNRGYSRYSHLGIGDWSDATLPEN